METQGRADRSKTIPTAAPRRRPRNYPRTSLRPGGPLPGRVTVIEVATYAAPDFPVWSWGDKAGLITVLLLLMAVKFWTVAYFFMHLQFDKPLLTRVFYSGAILAVLVYVSVLTMFRIWYPGEHG